MTKRILTEKRDVTELIYKLYGLKVYADKTTFSDVTELYFDGDVIISEGTANYEVGEIRYISVIQ
jgi:hypothetical protein